MVNNRYNELKKAEQGVILSIAAYVFVTALKLVVGSSLNSDALRADGLNNFTDILASIAVLIGLKISRKPADEEHRYGHWKAENVASLITSFIMLFVGAEVLYSSIKSMLDNKMEAPSISAAVVGILSAIIMYGVYFYNKRLAEKVNSSGLLAAAKDNLSDAWSSIGTAVAVFAASFNLPWLDSLTAVIIGGMILKTGIDIFRESAFTLSDGFDQNQLTKYRDAVEKIAGVRTVRSIRGRSYGSNIYIDITVTVDPHLTVAQSHQIADEVEEKLIQDFQIFDVDVHIEPFE